MVKGIEGELATSERSSAKAFAGRRDGGRSAAELDRGGARGYASSPHFLDREETE